MRKILLGIDPGDKYSGIIIFEEGKIQQGDNIENEKLFSLIDQLTLFDKEVKLEVAYEDIRPFTSRFNMNTINTIKMIGRLEYILGQRMVSYKSITRNEVKNWIYNRYYGISLPLVMQKIQKSNKKRKDGSDRRPSFVYVDDRIVILAMKSHWAIDVRKGGKTPLGIKKHAWQALAAATFYLESV